MDSGCGRHPPRVATTCRSADNIPYRPACCGRRPSSCRYRWLKPVRIPARDCEVTYQNGAPAPSIGVPTPRVIVESVDVHPCAELACCVRPPPRVTVVVQTRGSALSSSHCRGANRGFSRLGQSAQPTLLSLLWYKPGVRLPPRVANVVQTGGETLGGKWVDVSVSMG